MVRPRIQVLLDEAELTAEMRRALHRLEAEVELQPFAAEVIRDNHTVPRRLRFDARLLITGDPARVANGKLTKLLEWCDQDPCATLVVSADPCDVALPETAVTAGRPIDFVSAITTEDLTARLSGMCALRRSLDAMRSEILSLRRRERLARSELRRLNGELRDAGDLQRGFLPSAMPPMNGIDVETFCRPADVVSGDLYDVFRIDAERVAFVLADATGHGVSAGIVSALVLGLLRPRRELCDGATVEPDAVLERANEDLLDRSLPDCHFVAALFAIYHEPTRTLRWARGGCSYPIVARGAEPPRRIQSPGPVLGATRSPRFAVAEVKLQPGDTVVFHTDGLEALLLHGDSGLGCSDLHRTEWFQGLGRQSLSQTMRTLHDRRSALSAHEWHADDITAIAFRVRG
ncbi:MAG: SpoIIE family protein phosphatase [Planctomycetes bacterium]|nr:SpoIIE family protein phosphatase [Planctomycetota bacterium]